MEKKQRNKRKKNQLMHTMVRRTKGHDENCRALTYEPKSNDQLLEGLILQVGAGLSTTLLTSGYCLGFKVFNIADRGLT